MRVTVLRLGHRYSRDKRISTHIGLVSRAFGADELVFDTKDTPVKESIEKINELWGNSLKINFVDDWKKFLKDFQGDKIHLTMYGINVDDKIDKIKSSKKDKLIIVGGKKVPSEIYNLADYNIAIGNQPHSEVAALAIFLDRLFERKELQKYFHGKKRIIPQEYGKKVVDE